MARGVSTRLRARPCTPARRLRSSRTPRGSTRAASDDRPMTLTAQIAVFLAATVIAVPLFRRFKLSAVLGYIAAGLAIGPWGLGLFGDVDSILHFAELGVVLLLFVI